MYYKRNIFKYKSCKLILYLFSAILRYLGLHLQKMDSLHNELLIITTRFLFSV